ncbi:alpha/beta hydrolase [Kineococcus esterisolvens]|uniref:alpha/beta hydrolase n=1 Tax=unclassified Kineococcus TaxID=2621656 RepID=UPI003D7C3B38
MNPSTHSTSAASAAPTGAGPRRGVAAGVPYLALPPAGEPTAATPLVLTWHLVDAPRTPEAFAAALPLDGVDAWRVHLELPLTGSRLPAGGPEELVERGRRDAVLELFGPIAEQAVAEAPAVLAGVRTQLGCPDGPLALLGGSMGAAVAFLALLEAGLGASALVLVSPLLRLRPVVESTAARMGLEYAWSPAADAVAARIDAVARAGEHAAAGRPPVLLVVGADDDEEGFVRPAAQLHEALVAAYGDPERVRLGVVPGMGHALAAEPGLEAAPQTPHAARVDAAATDWLRAHLG